MSVTEDGGEKFASVSARQDAEACSREEAIYLLAYAVLKGFPRIQDNLFRQKLSWVIPNFEIL